MDKEKVLLRLSQLGAMERFVSITTKDLGERLSISQQSASLYLRELEEEGLIERTRRRTGSSIRITKIGVDALLSLYKELHSLLGEAREIEAAGTVTAGLGEGAYYLSQEQYRRQIKELFGFSPFAGTLNIGLAPAEAPLLDLLRRGPGIDVKGFEKGGRTFGSCLCYPCTVNGVEAVIVVPNRTVHTNMLEIISKRKLRDELGLKEGDEVQLKVKYPLL